MKHAGEMKLVRHNKASLIRYAADHAKSLKATTIQPVAALRPRPSLTDEVVALQLEIPKKIVWRVSCCFHDETSRSSVLLLMDGTLFEI